MKDNQDIVQAINHLNHIQDQTLQLNEKAILENYQKRYDDQSLAIKALSILGGFFAGLAFLGFIALTGLFSSNIGITLLGLICLLSAVLLNKLYDSILLDTLSVTFYIAGFILLIFGLLSFRVDESFISLVVIVLAFLSLSILQSYLLNFISVLIVSFSFLSLFMINDATHLLSFYLCTLILLLMYIFLNEAKIITYHNALSIRYNPIRIGLVVSLITSMIFFNQSLFFKVYPEFIWFSSIFIVLSILFLISKILNLLNVSILKYKILIYTFCLVMLLPTVLSPAISGAILILLLGFYVNHKTSFVLGLLSLIFFIIQYYYDLSFTLLTKSIFLIISGVLFILLYGLVHKKLVNEE